MTSKGHNTQCLARNCTFKSQLGMLISTSWTINHSYKLSRLSHLKTFGPIVWNWKKKACWFTSKMVHSTGGVMLFLSVSCCCCVGVYMWLCVCMCVLAVATNRNADWKCPWRFSQLQTTFAFTGNDSKWQRFLTPKPCACSLLCK